jgi:hypothetical protein
MVCLFEHLIHSVHCQNCFEQIIWDLLRDADYCQFLNNMNEIFKETIFFHNPVLYRAFIFILTL